MMHPRCWVHSSIDTHAPLILYSNRRLLVSNLLSLHLVRISPGQSVYLAKQVWKVARRSSNIYMACMGWLENLYEHILFLESCILYSIGCILISKQESHVISTAELPLTRELHIIRAHHLHYLSLLDHYTKHVTFIKIHPTLLWMAWVMRSVYQVENSWTGIGEWNRTSQRPVDHTQERQLKNVMDPLLISSADKWRKLILSYETIFVFDDVFYLLLLRLCDPFFTLFLISGYVPSSDSTFHWLSPFCLDHYRIPEQVYSLLGLALWSVWYGLFHTMVRGKSTLRLEKIAMCISHCR